MLNVLLGMSLAAGDRGVLRPWSLGEWVIAAGIGVYIVGVTWFARTEAKASSRGQLAGALAVVVGGLGLLASLAEHGRVAAPFGPWYATWAALALFVAHRCYVAVREPTPEHVQLAVRRCLISLILIDAAICYGVRGPIWAGAILLLVIPQWLAGRYVYST
jgi:4-hydroxybenzoate polyprenyltransferase